MRAMLYFLAVSSALFLPGVAPAQEHQDINEANKSTDAEDHDQFSGLFYPELQGYTGRSACEPVPAAWADPFRHVGHAAAPALHIADRDIPRCADRLCHRAG